MELFVRANCSTMQGHISFMGNVYWPCNNFCGIYDNLWKIVKFSNYINLICNSTLLNMSYIVCFLVGAGNLNFFLRLSIWSRLLWCGSQVLGSRPRSTCLFTTVLAYVASVGWISSWFIFLYCFSFFFIVVT